MADAFLLEDVVAEGGVGGEGGEGGEAANEKKVLGKSKISS